MTAEAILYAFSRRRGIRVSLLRGPGRHAAVAHPRHEAMWLLRTVGDMSFPGVGKELGGRHHATVMHGVRRVQRLVNERPAYGRELLGLIGVPPVPVDEGHGL